MALNYEVKKRVFGFDKTKTEKYVAQLKTLGIIQWNLETYATRSPK